MKKVALLVSALALVLQSSVYAENNAPRGSVLELHSCRLYAGGCLVSSEATQGGRYMVRAWNFSDGAFAGASLRGLTVAVLQVGNENLAEAGADSSQAVIYLPQNATSTQREAMLAWLKSTQKDLALAALKTVRTRVVPVSFNESANGYKLHAGQFLSVETTTQENCVTGACGESLWYSPRSANSLFTVALNRAASINEPALELKWADAGKKNIFLCKFGDDTPARETYVSLADFCGQAAGLF